MFKEFKKFILRGNVVDLAVGVVIGAAFTAVVNSLVKAFISPLIAVIYGQRQFTSAHFTINGSQFLYGEFINAVITFLIVAAAVFFFVVQPINKLSEVALKSKKAEEPGKRKCPYCFGEISAEATKCMYCTSSLKKEAKA